MTIQWVSWVLDHSQTTGSDRLVLISLANHANHSGACYPGIDRIAQEAQLSVRRTHDAIRRLEEGGHITRMVNAAIGDPDKPIPAGRRPNLYRLIRTGGEDEVSYPGLGAGYDGASPDGTTKRPTQGATERPTKPSVQPSVEPTKPLHLLSAADGFEEFWKVYPRQVRKDSARRAWASAVKRAPSDTILAGARVFREARRGQDEAFTPYPATWLNGGGWDDKITATPRRSDPHPAKVWAVDTDRDAPPGRLEL